MTEEFADYIKTEMEKAKPNISKNSLNLYIHELNHLNGGKMKDLKFLDDIPSVIKKLENYSDTTKRNHFIAICSVLKVMDNKKLYHAYYNELMKMNKIVKEKNSDGKKSDKQANNWITYSEVLETYNKLKERALSIKPGTVTKDEYNTILQYLVLSFYVLFPPRRNDYYSMKIVQNRKKLAKKELSCIGDSNIFDLDDRKMIFRDYKTKDTYETQTFDIPESLMEVVEFYLKFYRGEKYKKNVPMCEPLFLSYYKKKFTNSNNITYVLNKIFDKKIGSSMLRHIYLSDKYGDKVKEMSDDSEKMAHSSEMQKEYIKK